MKRTLCALLVVLLLLPTLVSCGADRTREETFFALDTVVTVRTVGRDAKQALAAVKEQIASANIQFSAHDPASEVSKINENAGQWVSVSAQILEQLAIAAELQATLPDTFSPFLLSVSEAWGFGKDTDVLPTKAQIAALLAQIEGATVEIDRAQSRVKIPAQTKIDLGAVAKGMIGKMLTQTLSAYRLTGAYLSLGGNVQLYREKADGTPWRIALTDPAAPQQLLGILQTDAKAIVTSGGYQRYVTAPDGTRYHHILDPKTGYPAKSGLASVTVICEDGAWADALSTALFVAGEERAVAYWHNSTHPFEFVLVREDGTIVCSEGIAADFTAQSENAKIETVLAES